MTIDVNKETSLEFIIENSLSIKYVFLIFETDKNEKFFFEGNFDPKTKKVSFNLPRLRGVIPLTEKTSMKLFLLIYETNHRIYQVSEDTVTFYFDSNVNFIDVKLSEQEIKVSEVKRKVKVGISKDNIEFNPS